MRRLARFSLGLLGLALAAPRSAEAQDATASIPSGYSQVAPSASASAAAPAQAPAAPQHKHWGRTICAKCAAKLKAQGPIPASGPNDLPPGANALPPGTIVGCEHSKNGVCAACAAALKQPGTFVMAGSAGQPAQPAEAPGRAVASSSPAPGRAVQPAYVDAGMAEPAPIGVVQAGFSQPGNVPAGMPASSGYANQVAPADAPGHAVAESTAGHEPYQAKSGPFPHPHIIRHLLFYKDYRAEKNEAKAAKKAEAHAKISYDENGNAPVDELPASMVFGKKQR